MDTGSIHGVSHEKAEWAALVRGAASLRATWTCLQKQTDFADSFAVNVSPGSGQAENAEGPSHACQGPGRSLLAAMRRRSVVMESGL